MEDSRVAKDFMLSYLGNRYSVPFRFAGKTVFFFSSISRHTRFSRDWSSDVCSSDLTNGFQGTVANQGQWPQTRVNRGGTADWVRLEERRVGKECRSRCSAYH